MSLVQDIAAETRARKERLGLLPRRQSPVIALPVVEESAAAAIVPALTPEEERELRLHALEDEVHRLSELVKAEIDVTTEQSDQPRLRPPVEQIIRTVARRCNVSIVAIKSPRRAQEVVIPRHIAMYLANKLTIRSLPDIGRRFGGRDHTTVLHAVRKITKARNEDAELDRQLSDLEQRILESVNGQH